MSGLVVAREDFIRRTSRPGTYWNNSWDLVGNTGISEVLAPNCLSAVQLVLVAERAPGQGFMEDDSKDRRAWRACHVLLLGWTGSKDRQLRKYQRLYAKEDIQTLAVGVGLKELGATPVMAAPRAKSILQRSKKLKPKHFIIHIFSNGGAFLYLALRRLLDQEQEFRDLRSSLCCVIMDSLPSLSPQPIWLPYLAQLATNDSSWEYASNFVWGSAYAVSSLLLWPWNGNPWDWYLKTLLGLSTDIPELLLYSTADALVPAAGIEKYIELRRERGCVCLTFNFGDSAHVNHFGKYPKIYEEQVLTFIKNKAFGVSETKNECSSPHRSRM
eukprot:jgi/Bigna1/126383/aug1.2_g1091